MSQNITLSATDRLDIAKIKQYVLDGKNQTEMSQLLGKRRETVNRKIARWMQTSDFDEWLGSLWLEHYSELRDEDKKEAFRQLTKLFVAKQTRRVEAFSVQKIEQHVKIDVSEDEDAVLSRAARILTRKRKSQSIH